MSDETEYSDEDEQVPTRRIEHIIRDERSDRYTKPKKKTKAEDKNDIQDNDKLEFLARASERFFESEKEKLIVEFPEYATKIRNVESGFDLDLLREKLEDDSEPYKAPSGRATLPIKTEPSDLETASDHPSLINKLYREQQKVKGQHRTEAKQKVDTLFDSLKNISIEHMSRTMRDNVWWTCPSCGSVNEGVQSRGVSCSGCGRKIGIDKIVKRGVPF